MAIMPTGRRTRFSEKFHRAERGAVRCGGAIRPEPSARSRGRTQHRATFVDGMAGGFLYEHMRASFQSGDRLQGVPVIRVAMMAMSGFSFSNNSRNRRKSWVCRRLSR